jgi:hypothetical protein
MMRLRARKPRPVVVDEHADVDATDDRGVAAADTTQQRVRTRLKQQISDRSRRKRETAERRKREKDERRTAKVNMKETAKRDRQRRTAERVAEQLQRRTDRPNLRAHLRAERRAMKQQEMAVTRYTLHDCGPRKQCEYCHSMVWDGEKTVEKTKDGLERPVRHCCKGGTHVLGDQHNDHQIVA